jgi:hypothetical protein
VTDQNPGRPDDPAPPEYNVYRARKRPLSRGADLDALRRRLGRVTGREPDSERRRRRITPGRVLKWLALAVAGWLLLSLVLFLVSAQLQEGV